MTFNNISNEKKIQMLNITKAFNENNLYKKLVQLNINPNNFILSDFDANNFEYPMEESIPEEKSSFMTLAQIVDRLRAIEHQITMI